MSVFVCKPHFWWRHVWRHLLVTMLLCWATFSNALVHWSVRMIRAKNYKTVTKFVKVMPRILWPLFFPGHGVYSASRGKTFLFVPHSCTLHAFPADPCFWALHGSTRGDGYLALLHCNYIIMKTCSMFPYYLLKSTTTLGVRYRIRVRIRVRVRTCHPSD